MTDLFVFSEFDRDISAWDMSAVLATDSMFYGCYLFNQDGECAVRAVTARLARVGTGCCEESK